MERFGGGVERYGFGLTVRKVVALGENDRWKATVNFGSFDIGVDTETVSQDLGTAMTDWLEWLDDTCLVRIARAVASILAKRADDAEDGR